MEEEIKIWEKLFNDNIIRLYEITDDYDNDFIYLTTEYAEYGAIGSYNEESGKI